MSKLIDPQRLVTVRKLTSELHALQERLNQTIDQMCDLLAGAELGDVVSTAAESASQRSMSPAFLTLPIAAVYKNSPPSGYALGTDCRLFSDYQTAALQTIQAPSSRSSEGRYSLVINYADFDGSFLSLVLDARGLLQGLTTGRARIGLVLDVRGIPQVPMHAKCAWRVGDQWAEQRLEAKSGRMSVDSFELPVTDLSQVQGLDFHFIFSPQSRGTIEIHRALISLVLEEPAAAAAASGAPNIFESVN